MAFRNFDHYKERIYYEPQATKVFKFPRGNLYAGITFDIRAEIDISGGVAANIPDFQIARMIKQLTITQNTNTIIQLSGEMLAAMFSTRNGVAAPGNTGIPVTVANNVQGRHYIYLPFAPMDALRPWDFLMDTRKYEYEMRIEFRDVTSVGTFFGSKNTLAATNAENYLDLELDQIDLKPSPNPAGGWKEDDYAQKSPLMRGLIERTVDVTQSNAQLKIELPEFKTFRNVMLWTTHETNANQTQGNGSVFDGKIELKDTQEKTYSAPRAAMLRERTAQRYGVSALNAGYYEMNMARWGSVTDAETADNVRKLYLLASVVKQANLTQIRVVSDTIEQQ